MFVPAFSLKSAITLLLLTTVPQDVYSTAIGRRADCCIGECPDDENGRQSPTLDAPTSDKSAGIGVEFETQRIMFRSDDCDKKSTDISKGKMAGNRHGGNWSLTVDTTLNLPGKLVAEYILDGTRIKVGSGDARANAAAVGQDILLWDPHAGMNNPQLDVVDSTCNPWTVASPQTGGAMASLDWALQVTAPLPLESIFDLFSKAVMNTPHPLLPRGVSHPERGIVLVKKDFFKAAPGGISSDSVKDDVLGFFSLVLSYAKGASKQATDKSPKDIVSIMPRTDFTNIFKQISATLPNGLNLYDLIKKLACYKLNDNTIELDKDYCTGDINNPQPTDKMDHQKFTTSSSEGLSDSVTVEDWMKSISNGDSPDRLTIVDRIIDGQIGGLKDALEKVHKGDRAVPLFEFRRLAGCKPGEMQQYVTDAEQAVIDYHDTHHNPPKLVKRRLDPRHRNFKRLDGCSVTTVAATPQATTTTPGNSGSEPTSSPPPQAQLTCTGVDSIKWMGREALNSVIPSFCEDAKKQGVQDKNSGSLVRNYNNGGDAVVLSMDWPVGSPFKPNTDDCVGYMTTIMDSCDGNDPDHNPMNWKHGGYNQVGDVRYNVIPNAERYKAGTCSVHVHQKETYLGWDGLDTKRTFSYHFDVQAKDADGNFIGGTVKDHAVGAGDKHPYVLSAYYAAMAMTPEAQGGDYIQFTIGDQSWTSLDDGDGVLKCHVGGWDSDYSPMARDMDCKFNC